MYILPTLPTLSSWWWSKDWEEEKLEVLWVPLPSVSSSSLYVAVWYTRKIGRALWLLLFLRTPLPSPAFRASYSWEAKCGLFGGPSHRCETLPCSHWIPYIVGPQGSMLWASRMGMPVGLLGLPCSLEYALVSPGSSYTSSDTIIRNSSTVAAVDCWFPSPLPWCLVLRKYPRCLLEEDANGTWYGQLFPAWVLGGR